MNFIESWALQTYTKRLHQTTNLGQVSIWSMSHLHPNDTHNSTGLSQFLSPGTEAPKAGIFTAHVELLHVIESKDNLCKIAVPVTPHRISPPVHLTLQYMPTPPKALYPSILHLAPPFPIIIKIHCDHQGRWYQWWQSHHLGDREGSATQEVEDPSLRK